MSIGSCLLANELEGMGKEMLEMRIAGESWASIAQKFDLPNPGAARAKFTKLTGITDYKAKGKVLTDLANDLSAKASKTGIFAEKQAVKNVKKAKEIVDITDDADFPQWVKDQLKWTEKNYGVDHPIYKAKLKEYQETYGKVPGKSAAKSLEESLAKTKEPTSLKWKSNSQIADDTGLTYDQVGSIIEKNGQGKGYLAIKNETGASFEQIDDVVWNSLLKKHDGDVWKAYQDKVTSQSGFDAVQDAVMQKKKLGMSNKAISEVYDMPEEIVDAITKGKWQMPSPGSTKPYIPPAPPKPAATFGEVPDGFPVRSNEKMMEWISPDDATLPHSQRSAISSYTGSGYTEINGYLRGTGGYYGSSPERMETLVTNLDKAMRPVPFNTQVVRHVSGTEVFGTGNLENMVGKVVRDKGYMSTTIAPSGVFTSSNVKMVIDVPQGASARYVQGISVHKGEKELLLARNTPMKIKAVERQEGNVYGTQRWTVYLEVIA